MKKRVVFLFIIVIIIFMQEKSFAKYVIEYTNQIAQISIDTKKPEIQFTSYTNTNSYKAYANKNHTIKIRISVVESNVKENYFDTEHVKILVAGNEVIPNKYTIKKVVGSTKMTIYELEISGIEGDGALQVKIPEGTIIDISDNTNKTTLLNIGVEIDNTAPAVTFSTQVTQEGKEIAEVMANEKIQTKNGWEISSEKTSMSKEFENNVSYPFPVTDYAQNTTTVDIEIKKATYMYIRFGVESVEQYWEFSTGNNEIMGKKFLANNPIEKIEMLSLATKGNVARDFIQLRVYEHTYWGEGKKYMSNSFETYAYHGYNPSADTFSSFANNGIGAMVEKEPSIIIGGDGVNNKNKTANGKDPIPEEIAKQYLHGISSLTLKLSDTSYYSIIYQIYVLGQGWQKVAQNGEEAVYKYDKPMSACRISIIPNTEKQYLIDQWNKDIGTNNM